MGERNDTLERATEGEITMPGDPRYYPHTWAPTPKSPIGRVLQGGADTIRSVDKTIQGLPGAAMAGLESLVIDPSSPRIPTRPQGIPQMQAGLGGGMSQVDDEIVMPDLPPPPSPPTPRRGQADIFLPPAQSPLPVPPPFPQPGSGMREGQMFVPNAYDPSKETLATANYTGPRLDTEEALAGLKSSGSMQNFSDEPDWTPDTEELYRHAFADPETMAPGAPQMASNTLKGRLGDEAYGQAQDRAQQKMAMDAITRLHPAVQAEQEAEALRKTYPQQAQAQGLTGQGEWDYRARKAAAEATAGGNIAERDLTSNRAMMESVIKEIGLENRQVKPDMERIKTLQQILTMMRMGQFDTPVMGE